MTREEKISILRQVKDIIQRSDSWMDNAKNAVNEAFEDAIEALQTEPCEDAISRQAVDEYISHWMSGYIYDEERTRLEEFSAWLWDELPPVNPQKVGRWGRKIVDGGYNADWICSECGYKEMTDFPTKFCPNCGAKMEEGDK